MMVLKNESLNGVFQTVNEGMLKIAVAGLKGYIAEMQIFRELRVISLNTEVDLLQVRVKKKEGLSSTIGNEREKERELSSSHKNECPHWEISSIPCSDDNSKFVNFLNFHFRW